MTRIVVGQSLAEHMAKSGDLTPSTVALLDKYGLDGCLDLVANWTAPYVNASIYDELRGVADGSGVSYETLLRVHLFPEFIEVRPAGAPLRYANDR